MTLVVGADVNKHDIVLEVAASAVDAFPPSITAPSTDDAGALNDMCERLAGHLTAHGVGIVAIVSDVGRVSPSDGIARGRLEGAVMLAARRAGAVVVRHSTGDALKHLGLDTTGNKRRRLRSTITGALGSDRVSRDPERRAAALAVGLRAADLSLEQIQ